MGSFGFVAYNDTDLEYVDWELSRDRTSPHAQWKYIPSPKYRKTQCSSFSLPLPLSTSLFIPLHPLMVPERDLSFFDVSVLLFMLLSSIFPVCSPEEILLIHPVFTKHLLCTVHCIKCMENVQTHHEQLKNGKCKTGSRFRIPSPPLTLWASSLVSKSWIFHLCVEDKNTQPTQFSKVILCFYCVLRLQMRTHLHIVV